MRSKKLRATMLCLISAVLFVACRCIAQQPTPDLSSATIEELMNIRVTSVAKREQALSDAPGAIYVITREEIRRSGVETLAEALRMAPGVEVAQISANLWAISIRGFNSQFSNKLLVLIDGRTVYTPTFSGVFWNEQDLLLEDIERIEVIRGPGATMWGTNAVNGVINIITRSSEDTEGLLAGAEVGTLQQFTGFGRYGGRIGRAGHYRIYVKHARRVDLPVDGGLTGDDGWGSTRGGFRTDWQLNPTNFLTVQGDGSSGSPYDYVPLWLSTAPFPGYSGFHGGNMLARWRRVAPSGSELRVQVDYDDARESFPGIIELRDDSFDVDLQHNIVLAKRHQIVWGGTFRNVRARSWGSAYAQMEPAARTLRTFSGFVQDEVTISPTLHLTAGSKFESNEFTGLEIQPTLRLMFAPSKRHAAWAAASRAVRSPSAAEMGARTFFPYTTAAGTVLALLMGNPHIKSEELLSYEAGYRTQLTQRFSVDIAGFVNRYHHELGLAVAPTIPPAPDIVPLTIWNAGKRKTYGIEAAAAYTPLKRWKITGSYSWFGASGSAAAAMTTWPMASPAHQFQIHSYFSLAHGVELDSQIYFVGAQPEMALKRYTRADFRLGWRANRHVEWSVAGQNLLDASHPEFSAGSYGMIEIRRSVAGKMTWTF